MIEKIEIGAVAALALGAWLWWNWKDPFFEAFREVVAWPFEAILRWFKKK